MSVETEKPLLRALAGKSSLHPPIWLMRQAGRYLPEYRALRARAPDFLRFCYTPDLAVEATLQPIRRFGLDAAILFSDILVVPDALGQNVGFVEGEGPRLEPLRGPADLARLRPEDVERRLEPVYAAVRGVRAALPAETALIGFAGAPWTVACYMVEGGGSRDFVSVKRLALGDPEGFQNLIDILTRATIAHLSRQIEAGAEAVQLFDSWAGVLPEGAFHRWAVAPGRMIVDALHAAYPRTPVIGFPRGAGVMARDYFAKTGIDCIGLDSSYPAHAAARDLQPLGVVQGNLDPVYLLVGGEAMTAAARSIVAALGRAPFVFNLGHGVIKETPPEHVAALVAAVRSGNG